MRRLIIPTLVIALGLVVAVLATYGGGGRAQVPLPTPKGQLGGRMPLGTLPAAPPSVSPTPTPTPAPRSAVGSWLVTNPRNRAEPPSLLTFASDGTVTGAAGDAHGSSFHGAWGATGDGSANFTLARLAFDANGTYSGVVEVRGTLRVDATGNAWDGQLFEEVFGPGGVVKAVTGPTPAHGTRISVQPIALFPPAGVGTPGT